MLQKKNENKKLLVLITLILIGLVFGGILYFNKSKGRVLVPENFTNDIGQKPATDHLEPIDPEDKTAKTDEIVHGKIIALPDIDYKNLKIDEELKQLMASRKEELGFKKSLDMIVNSDETFKVGDVQIPLRDILEKARFKEGKVFEEKIQDSGAVLPEKIKKFGIYVVQTGDNIWNIHFNILKEYYENQGIKISPVADEPLNQGMSSGIGKILKFSEKIVIIYNLSEKKIDSNINLIEPLSKIIIYNMDEIFSLLQEVNYENIDRIQFDGKTIWVPTKKI